MPLSSLTNTYQHSLLRGSHACSNVAQARAVPTRSQRVSASRQRVSASRQTVDGPNLHADMVGFRISKKEYRDTLCTRRYS